MAWRVRSDIALGVVCGMSRISLVVMTGHAAPRTAGLAGGYEAIYIGCGRNVLMSTAGPRPTPLTA